MVIRDYALIPINNVFLKDTNIIILLFCALDEVTQMSARMPGLPLLYYGQSRRKNRSWTVWTNGKCPSTANGGRACGTGREDIVSSIRT